MVNISSSTKLFAGVGLAVLAVPRLGNVRLRLHFLRRGTSGGTQRGLHYGLGYPQHEHDSKQQTITIGGYAIFSNH